jgi:phage replication-related protein YjqB (UPF0714/DUF867 family)
MQMTEWEKNCYGMSETEMRAQYGNYINAVGTEMFVAGILSDCQELGVSEEVRKMLNKAKFFLFETMKERA